MVIVIYRHLLTYGMMRRNSCICYLNICTSSNARSRDEGRFSRQGNIMQHNTCSVCTSFSVSHIAACLFIHSKKGTVHTDEHLHVNAPDYSHRLISVCHPPLGRLVVNNKSCRNTKHSVHCTVSFLETLQHVRFKTRRRIHDFTNFVDFSPLLDLYERVEREG